MKIQCDYCGNTYEDTLKKCPNCGAPNPSHHDGDVRPKTIEELREWYQARKLPPENVTRFFIGKDIKEPKAFGIYRDSNGDFIVYKNKADGTRAVRYQGDDEQYAVNEIYQKLKDEIVHQKSLNQRRTISAEAKAESDRQIAKSLRSSNRLATFAVIVGMIFVFCLDRFSDYSVSQSGKHNGYYSYDNEIYYNDYEKWYRYDDEFNSWSWTEEPSQYDSKNTDPYFMGRSYSDAKAWEYSDSQFSDVTDSYQYQENHKESSSDSDSYDNYYNDYDWGNDSNWDTDATDWDSDW